MSNRLMKNLLLAVISVAAINAKECPNPTPGFKSENHGGSNTIVWNSRLPFDCFIYWVDLNGEEKAPGVLPAFETQTGNSYNGHAFRVRTFHGVLIAEARVIKDSNKIQKIETCGDIESVETQLYEEGRAEEYESLMLNNPCEGPSSDWSCVRKLDEEEYNARNPDEYGFTKAESPHREGVTIDYGYVKQIPSIPKVSQGPGYLHMKMPPKMWKLLKEWFNNNRGAIETHEAIPGGYTNNEWLGMTKLNLDGFPEIRSQIVREMQSVLQWWCDLRLKHTSTYGVRIYRRDSMLIDHVDRQDTHLASAVLQVAQTTDADGGWPLEVLLPNKTVGEVYLQPGEMVLYEGAWIRHGRPKRFKGDEFANVFTHFAPLEWKGPSIRGNKIDRNTRLPAMFHGYEPGRCNTVGDDSSRGIGCTEPNFQPGPGDAHKRDEL